MRGLRSFWKIASLALALLSVASPGSAQVQGGLLRGKGLGLPGSGQGPAGALSVSAQFTAAQADKPARLFVTAQIRPGWHIYSITQAPGGPLRTKIKLNESSQYRVTGPFEASPPPERKTQPEAFKDLVVETHEGTVTWHAPIEVASSVDWASLKIEGTVQVQLCDANSCYPPEDFAFVAQLGPGIDLPELAKPAPSAPEPGHTASPAPQGPLLDPEQLKQNIEKQSQEHTLWVILVAGFLGGLILNIMPCVLPVIGLKILSFVEQAGQDRKIALMLNVWYSLGLISVFWALALLAIAAQLGWGQLFQYPAFNVVMAAVVFTLALSFLGVWEFPIPGFAGRGRAMELAQQEGFVGAFAKGIVTTLLATPCTGPYLGTALTWSLRQPPSTILLTFTSMGLGMASPYLLIGLFPRLIRFLPKPGPWMDTFKQIMGFVLLGTVVYLFTFLETSYLVPTLGLLMALWLACWWVARTPITAEPAAKRRAWLEAAAWIGVIWVLLFPGLDQLAPEGLAFLRFRGLHEVMADRLQRHVDHQVGLRLAKLRPGQANPGDGQGTASIAPPSHDKPQKTSEHDLPWQAFTTRAELEKLLAAGKTVLIDFTADWCATCKTLEAWYLNTHQVRQLVEANGVVTLKADWTHHDPEVTAMLELLGARQVPVIAIFPAGQPNNPIRFLDGYTTNSIVEALRKAGPSKPGPAENRSAQARRT